MIREICKGLPVELDICLLQSAHELTVIQPHGTHGSADPGNPERPELTFFCLSVAVCVLKGLIYGLYDLYTSFFKII